MYNVASLFAGVGGICLGFKRASEKYRLTLANEIDKNAIKTYKLNFDHKVIQGDIEKILSPEIVFEEIKFLKERKNTLEEIFLLDSNFYFEVIDHKNFKKNLLELKKTYIERTFANGNIQNFSLNESIKKSFKTDNTVLAEKFIEKEIVKKILQEIDENEITEKYSELTKKKKELLEEKIDILTAGFPCQAFSIAGSRKGFADHRGELFYSVINYVIELEKVGYSKPRILFLENVKNLVSHDEGRTFERIRDELEKLGYKLKYKVLNTNEYSLLPQNRERIFIVCFLNEDDYNSFSFENLVRYNMKSKEHLKEEIENVLELDDKIGYEQLYYTKEKYPLYFRENLNLEKEITEKYAFYQLRRVYIRKNQAGICPTLTANMGTGGHNVPLIKTSNGIRKLSPEECFNLQGFRVKQKKYILPNITNSALYKQAGNAVSVDVIENIARELFKVLEKNI